MSDPTHPPIGSSGGVSDVSSTPPKDEREAPILDAGLPAAATFGFRHAIG